MQTVRLVVVIPVGPTCRPEYVSDTIDSVEYFTTRDRVIVLIDDSHIGTGERLRGVHPDLRVWPTDRVSGRRGGLYRTLCEAFRRVLTEFHFDALLRLDTDALVIGERPEDDAVECFRANPLVASAGNYRHEYGGADRDYSWQIAQIEKQSETLRSLVRRPRGCLALRSVLRAARATGYQPGDDVFGGACFYSETGLRALQRRGWLPHDGLARAYLEEDHMFGLTLRACGFEFVDLWDVAGSFACTWGRLPAAPDELALSSAKVTHSVRTFDQLDETAIRARFRAYRSPARQPARG